MNIESLEAGPETDLAVAEIACKDDPVCVRSGVCYIGFNFKTGSGVSGGEREFNPSHDWNDAMWAAQQVGLFQLHGPWDESETAWMHQIGDSKWAIWKMKTSPDYKRTCTGALVETCSSGPLAICKAIIKLTGNSKQ